MKRFRFIDHTGDLGIEVYGQSLKELFENAGQAFFLVITDSSRVQQKVERVITLPFEDLGTLMVDWLGQLLYLHDVDGILFCQFEVKKIEAGSFVASAWGEFFQEGRHVIRTEVKAVTFHQLEVRERRGRWHARVILDL